MKIWRGEKRSPSTIYGPIAAKHAADREIGLPYLLAAAGSQSFQLDIALNSASSGEIDRSSPSCVFLIFG